MSTTLPLFWDLSSASKQKRLKSSAELISTLQHFQSQFAPPAEGDDDDDSSNDSQDDDDDESGEEVDGSDDGEGAVVDKDARRLDRELDRKNSEDVRYSIRRLVRGLASPRESSRLGFAVALTEVSTLSISCLSVQSARWSRAQRERADEEEGVSSREAALAQADHLYTFCFPHHSSCLVSQPSPLAKSSPSSSGRL